MKIKELTNKKIFFLGLGIENLALINFLAGQKITADFTVGDHRLKKDLAGKFSRLKTPVTAVLGKNYDHQLENYDIIFRSPGYPLSSIKLIKAQKKGVIVSSPVNLFLENCPTKNTIAVTGTKGKGTTASLIQKILLADCRQSYLGGNIGVAPFDFFKKLTPTSWVILELSSFQLEDLTVSPKIFVLTNFFAEHLAPADIYNPNFHKNLNSYWLAKLKGASLNDNKNILVANWSLKSQLQSAGLNAKILYFQRSALKTKLLGEHNRENIAAAEMVAKILKINPKSAACAVAGFKSLEHRLEFVKKIRGVDFYNDSFATTEESAMTALNSFSQPVILFLGGADKGAGFGNRHGINVKR